MMLFERFMEPCVRLIRTKESDGEGGQKSTWTAGEQFLAAVVQDRASEIRVAEREALRKFYTVTTAKEVQLNHQDVFRRLSDGQTFRVTRDGRDVQTPACASFSFAQVSAERWELV